MRSRNDNFHGFCGLSGLSGSFRNTEDTARFKNHVTLQRNDPGYPVTTGLWKHNYYQAIEPKKVWYLDNHIALRAAIEGKGIALDLPFSLTEDAIKKRIFGSDVERLAPAMLALQSCV